MTSSVEEWVNSSLCSITHDIFTDCVNVTVAEIKPLTDQIVVIVSDIFRVTLILHFKNGDTKRLKAVFKTESSKEGFGKMAQELELSKNETTVYNKFLKEMEKIIKSHEDKDELLWPDCYLSNNTSLLLKDLCEDNYRVVATTDLLNIEHVKMAMKMIGKYHGLGLVLKQKGIFEPNEIPTSVLAKKLEYFNNLYSGSLKTLADVVDKYWEPEWKPVSEKLHKAAENVNDKLAQLVKSSQGKCSVLNHGDFSIRNIIFQYKNVENMENPIRAKLIDFQNPCWVNLGFDLVSLLGMSMLPQTRDKYIDALFNIYAESLSETCDNHGYQGYVPTARDVQESYNSLGYYLLVTVTFALPAMLAAGKDFKPDSLLENNKPAFDASFYKSEVIKQSLKHQLRTSLKQNIL